MKLDLSKMEEEDTIEAMRKAFDGILKLLGAALVQIRDKRYGEGADGRTRLRIGLVFDGPGRRFVTYKVA